MGTNQRNWVGEFVGTFLLLFAVLALLFHGVWPAGHTLFSNDGPLGRLISDCHHLPDRFFGCWSDLNGIGFSGGAAPPGVSVGLQYLLEPVWFSKLYALISLLILGLGAWCFFSQMRLTPLAARLGGLAAALNSCFFSVACWGVAAQPIAAGLGFFALAALADLTGRRRWWRIALAGFAVGLCVVDGADVGVIFSLLVALWVVWQAWIEGGPPAQRLLKASTRLVVIVLCSGFIAAQALSSLVGTSITGTAAKGTTYSDEQQQAVDTSQGRWDWATQWSLPLSETAGLVFPGLFGYRMDTPDGGAYWGNVGQNPAVTRYLENGRTGTPPGGFIRYSGGGFYAGVFVVMVALWAVAESFRRRDSVFDPARRRWLWFWLALAVVSLLLAYGRFAPVYQLVYPLPYFSSIRNPIKFIYVVSLALIVLFACGVHGLQRRYMPAGLGTATGWPGWRVLWGRIGKPEKAWLWGCAGVLGLTLLGWFQYASARPGLVDYLRSMQIDAAEATADFSIRQVGWFVFYLVLAMLLLAAVFGGLFTGRKARWGGLAIGILLLMDLGRANLPWIVCWNYEDKYAGNPVVEFLRDQPYEHRVTYLPGAIPAGLPDLNGLYRREWLQQQFPYYNIQTLDIIDMPRKPADFVAYVCGPKASPDGSGAESYLQMWRLTNTRYLLGLADDLATWNLTIGDTNQELRIVKRFNLVLKPGVTNADDLSGWTAVTDAQGPFALFDYTGALPRARLYTHWQVQTNDPALLNQLFDPAFDARHDVLVSGGVPPAAAPAPQENPGTVDFAHYSPRDIVLKSDAPAASVLLLNDHFDPAWKVFVDGQPQTLLRCNFIMRGVYLAAGTHTVEFRHQPPFGLLYVSLAAIAVSLLALTVVLLDGANSNSAPAMPAAPVNLVPKMTAAPVSAGDRPVATLNGAAMASPSRRRR